MSATVSSETIGDLTKAVTEAVLNMSVEPRPLCETPSLRSPSMFGWVSISGAWDGSVMIGCSQLLARRAAGVMFDLVPESATSSDVVDAIGELANVLGGNLKGLLPGPSVLSLPNVSTEPMPDSAGPCEACELWFQCDGEPLVVKVIRRTDGATRP